MSRRAATYLRISEDRDGTGLAVARQREDCHALIAARGWVAVAEHIDNDTSAAGRKRRPGFEQLMADIEADHIDTIVALSLDRLTRNRRDQLRLIETCQRHRTLVALVKGSDVDMTTAVGRAMADMMAVWARMEIEQKSERHRRQVLQAARAGQPGGGPRAFGYLPGGREPHPVEAPVVADLYHRFLAGAPLNTLAAQLNNDGHVTPRGGRWGASSVRVVLANPRYAGLRGLRPLIDETSERRARWHDVIAPGQWPAIVDESTWRAADAILRDPSRGTGPVTRGGNQPRHLLSGIITCGVCGQPMKAGSGNGGTRTYRCPTDRARSTVGPHIVRSAAHLEAYITQVLLERLLRPDAAALLAPVADGEAEIDVLRGRAVELRAQLRGLAVDYADGVLDREQVRVSGTRLRAKLAVVEAQIGELGQVDVVAPLVLAGDMDVMRAVWDGYPATTRRLVIAKVMQVVVLRGRRGRPPVGVGFDPASVRVTWLSGSG